MRRCALLVLSTTMLLAGCFGRDSYEKRMEQSLDQARYKRRVDANLMPAAADPKFKELAIFVRPPKDEEPTKVGQLAADEGQYELDSSFVDKAGPALHLLARVKLPKKPPAKGAPPAPAPAQRGDFTRDVLTLLVGHYNAAEGLATPKFVDEKKGRNAYKRLQTNVNDKGVEKVLKLYTYKNGNHEAALIFVFEPKQQAALGSKIDLCLETFATGARAANGGQDVPEEAAGGGATVPL